ncbi:MAG: TetR/AcrR family transcriptional regulator [Myxococcota bacterium]|nr:TetR/AcrR family transcriptional regulator [Myxococcota bacterium]
MVQGSNKEKTNYFNKKQANRAGQGSGQSDRSTRISVQGAAGWSPGQKPPGIRKQPSQQRSKEMVAAVLEAAADIFAKLGYAGATTNKIAERAGVSVGSLYQYFPNKDSLLACLMAKHHAEVHQVIDKALERLSDPTVPLDHGVRGFLTDLVALHEANPALTKALSAEVLRASPTVNTPDQLKGDLALALQVGSLLAARPDVRQGDVIAMAAVLGQTTTQLTRWLVHDVPPTMDRATLQEEVVQLLLRYLEK